jgi:hemoglobin-like flavoprotein
LFESLAKIDFLGEAVLPDCVMVTKTITRTFQRKMNIFLNKPVVMEMLRRAQQSENEHLAELAKATFTFVKSF